MDSLKETNLLKFNKDTLLSVRKVYDLDKPGRIDDAINIIEEWVKKQDHFTVKNFPRDYLERKIILCKGSVERVKKQLDKTCTLRTLLPAFYESINFKTDYKDSNIILDAILPKLTEDNYRVYLVKFMGKKNETGFTNYYRFAVTLIEYAFRYDYFIGAIVIIDYTDTNILDIIKNLDLVQLRQFFILLIDSYGVKIKNIHIISPSKAVETVLTIFKQVVTAKIAERIQAHKDVKTLYKFVSKSILPIELGGQEKSIKELHEQWVDAVSSTEFQELYSKIKEAKTKEEYRKIYQNENEYMGISGTFRTLSVD
ncbi:uncharacterized protein [Battus philenor]|uniref:uncharacterized protein n=1 Tax=Battus philenor TaxID=42288 RepID=UPI0035CE8FB4